MPSQIQFGFRSSFVRQCTLFRRTNTIPFIAAPFRRKVFTYPSVLWEELRSAACASFWALLASASASSHKLSCNIEQFGWKRLQPSIVVEYWHGETKSCTHQKQREADFGSAKHDCVDKGTHHCLEDAKNVAEQLRPTLEKSTCCICIQDFRQLTVRGWRNI